MSEGTLTALIFQIQLEIADKIEKLMELGRIETTNGVDFTDATTGEILAIFQNGEFVIDKYDCHNASLRMYNATRKPIGHKYALINDKLYITETHRIN